MTNATSFINTDKLGNVSGTCVFCGKATVYGFKAKFSGNFTGYNYLYAGDCFCPKCHEFFTNQDFRKKNWIATSSNITFCKKKDILQSILNPPKPPFFIYLTKSYQRQGWLASLKYINNSRDKFFISCDFIEMPVWTSSMEVSELYDIIKQLRDKKVSKTKLSSGDFGMYLYKIAYKDGWTWLLDKAKENVKKPIWEILVYAAD